MFDVRNNRQNARIVVVSRNGCTYMTSLNVPKPEPSLKRTIPSAPITMVTIAAGSSTPGQPNRAYQREYRQGGTAKNPERQQGAADEIVDVKSPKRCQTRWDQEIRKQFRVQPLPLRGLGLTET